MKKIIAAVMVGTMAVSMIGCATADAENTSNLEKEQTSVVAEGSMQADIDEGELFIGKIVSSKTEGKITIITVDALFGEPSGSVDIIIDEDTDMEASTDVGYPEGYLISVFYDKGSLKDVGGKNALTAKVLSAVEEDQIITLDPIEQVEQGSGVVIESPAIMEGELYIGKIVSSETEKDAEGNETTVVTTEGIFGLDKTINVIIDKDTIQNNTTVEGYPKGYLISIYYDKDEYELSTPKAGEPMRVRAKMLSAVEENKTATINMGN